MGLWFKEETLRKSGLWKDGDEYASDDPALDGDVIARVLENTPIPINDRSIYWDPSDPDVQAIILEKAADLWEVEDGFAHSDDADTHAKELARDLRTGQRPALKVERERE